LATTHSITVDGAFVQLFHVFICCACLRKLSYRSIRNSSDKMDVTSESKKWLELAEGLDYSAKMLIRYCLEQASQDALDKTQKLVKLAQDAGLEDGIEFSVIRFITSKNELEDQSETDEKARRLLEDRINRLMAFKDMADELARAMLKQLEG